MTRRLAVWGLLLVASAQAQPLVYQNADLRDVIADVERRTDWRFLYADALVVGKRLRVQTTVADLPNALARSLAPQGIGVEADAGRRRILLVPAPVRTASPPPSASARPPPVRRLVRGRVLDADTGEPLPFATVAWEGGRRGVVSDAGGAFVASLDPSPVSLTASFVGYRTQTAAPSGTSVTFRLQPEVFSQASVVVDALALGALDTAWAARVQPGRFDAIAEGGGLRALDVLPSVAPSAVFDDGLVVRGSPSDAFEVRLDGIPIYNPRHLFGLADAFNADALRAVALHVGVAPARVAIAPGGAVDYVTATGSPRRPTATAGLSSLAARASAAVPLRPGRTSLLVGGRGSTLGPWADDLVEQGLGVARRTSPLPLGTAEALTRVVDVQGTSARFWDLHAGLADERPDGGRTVATAYAGGDATGLDAFRTVARPTAADPDELVRQPVETRSRWGSRALSLADRRLLSARVALSSTLGASLYDAQFAQDDFAFRFRLDGVALTDPRIDTLGYDNDLREVLVAQQLDVSVGGGVASGGYRLHLYRQRYEETAATRPTFVSEQSPTRLDLHAAWDGAVGAVDLDAGLRAHLYSEDRLRLSPRLRVRLPVTGGAAVSGGIGRSIQFAHRLTLDGVAGAAAWVLSGAGDAVTEADLAELAVEASAGRLSVHLATYAKRTRGLWLHAEDRAVQRVTDASSILSRPWLTGVRGEAVGLEVLASAPVGAWSVGLSAALARSELAHPALNNGALFAADWDRRVRATALVDGPLARGVRLAASWTVASGAPNPLLDGPGEDERLAPVSRLDLRLSARRQIGSVDASLAVAVRNATDRDNVVTRELTPLVRRAVNDRQRLVTVPLDLYDVGALPSVDLSLRW